MRARAIGLLEEQVEEGRMTSGLRTVITEMFLSPPIETDLCYFGKGGVGQALHGSERKRGLQ